MAKRKRFNIEDLYPVDYYFDWEAFNKDPEGYQFTEADIAYSNAMELARYEAEVPMTPYEKRALRKWVVSGHSPLENTGSKYLCISSDAPYDFLDIYRMDRELEKEMRGMTDAEKKSYLMEYMGWTDEPDHERSSDLIPIHEEDIPF